MITATGLHKRFDRGRVLAVADVSFRAADGQITGLIGPNGAGKTTTMRMICGLVTPDGGRASVDGIEVTEHPTEVRRAIGVLPDARGLYPKLTSREHIEYFGRLHGLDQSYIARRVAALTDKLDMADIIDRRTAGFSQGQRMKVAIARALVHDPKNIMLDEPTNGLDVPSTRAMRALLRDLRDEGRCVVLSSHVMHEVAALCDRVVVVAGGKVAAEGTADELRAQTGQDTLEDAFVDIVGSGEGMML